MCTCCSLCELLVREVHGGSLMGQFCVFKTLGILHDHFFWPHMKLDVERICEKYITCREAKSKLNPMLCTSLCLFPTNRRLIFQWTLSWVYIGSRMGEIQFCGNRWVF